MHNARMLVCQWKLHEQKIGIMMQVNDERAFGDFSNYIINKTYMWKNSLLMKMWTNYENFLV